MVQNINPEDVSFNEEPATADEIAFMEGLASDLLDGFPAEYCRQYAYATGESGSIAIFSTRVFEEEFESGSLASVMIAKGALENVKLSITFGYDNKPSNLFLSSDEELDDITSFIQDLLDCSELQSADATVLRHLQSIVFCVRGLISSEDIGISPGVDSNEKFQQVGDVIRSQVDKKTTCAVRTKVWGLPLDDDSSLTIVSNEILGDLSENNDVRYLPTLQVEYKDYTNKIIYIYTKRQDGVIMLDTEAMGVDETENFEPDIDESIEEQVALFVEELGVNVPIKKDVTLITSKLSQAVLIDC